MELVAKFKGYDTKIAYKRLLEEAQNDEEEEANKAYRWLWKNYAPNRVKVIVWKALKGRLPTKVVLKKRGISMPNDDARCPLCRRKKKVSLI